MSQVIKCHKYTYETDLPVKIGDTVVLPGRGEKANWQGVVTALESKYGGPCKRVVGFVQPLPNEPVRSLDEMIALQPQDVQDAIRQVIAEAELYGPVELVSFAIAAGRLLAAARRGMQSHRQLPPYIGG